MTAALLAAFLTAGTLSGVEWAAAQEPVAVPPPVMTGIDVLAERGFADIKGKRVGLITNQTGHDAKGRATFQILANASDVTLSALFGACFLLGLDTLQRALLGAHALPPGVAMSLVGGPFFLALLLLSRRELDTW